MTTRWPAAAALLCLAALGAGCSSSSDTAQTPAKSAASPSPTASASPSPTVDAAHAKVIDQCEDLVVEKSGLSSDALTFSDVYALHDGGRKAWGVYGSVNQVQFSCAIPDKKSADPVVVIAGQVT